MNLEATLFDNRNNKYFDVSRIIGNLEITTCIEDQPGKCTFDILRVDDLAFWEGATIAIKIDQAPIFKGFVFTKKRDKQSDLIKVTCFDQLRYLKNKDAFVFEGVTSSQIFEKLCKEYVLTHKVVDASSYICAPRTNDGKALYDMIKYALSETLIATGNRYIIRDNFGVLEHVSIKSLNSGLLLGDGAGVIDFDYQSSIDKDVYNQVKLYQDNKKNNTRKTKVVNDTINGGSHLKQWGILQLFESVTEELNDAQMQKRAQDLLKYYNNVKRTLKLECLGSTKVFAGATINCKIKDLGDLSLDKALVVTECTHKIVNEEHLMILSMEVFN